MLDDALRYAVDLGWYVFPCHHPLFKEGWACSCEAYARSEKNRERLAAQGKEKFYNPEYTCPRPGKHPRTFSGLDDANIDPAQIRKWWAKWPSANIGVNCGKSGLLVIDLDYYKDVYEGNDLELDENTVTAITGGGGCHLFYEMEDSDMFGNKKKNLPPGIDIRGHGGYVIVAPSLHASGNRYQWEIGYSPWEGGE